MDMLFWHPTKPKIQSWVDAKELDFAQKEIEGSRWMLTKWLEQYIYLDIHEILFSEFPIVLYEWLSKLKTHKNKSQGGETTKWTSF